MLKSSLKEELIKAKKELEKSYVIFYSDGKVRKEVAKDINDRLNSSNDQFFWIEEQFKDACSYYGRRHEFDSLNMGLILGVLFDGDDVNPDETIKEGAHPVNDLVHFYTGEIDSYLDGDKTNTEDFSKYHYQSQSFLRFSHLLSEAKKNGIKYDGPESFDELVASVKSRQENDINLSLSLVEDKPMSLKRNK